jgi:hypothetical protein
MFRCLLDLGAIATLVRLVCARSSLEMSLYVLRDGRCIAIPPRTVQMHKGLTEEVRVVIEDIGPFEDGHSHLITPLMRLYAEKEETLWIHARMLCVAFEDVEQHSSDTLSLENDIKSQLTLDGSSRVPSPPPPPMILTPLLISGPSENRVDLVFFGDGCKCFYLKYTEFFTLELQTRQRKRVNSSRMQQGWLTISLLTKPLPP